MLALAEKERDFIRSRQTGKKKGVYRGRKPSVPVEAVRKMKADGGSGGDRQGAGRFADERVPGSWS